MLGAERVRDGELVRSRSIPTCNIPAMPNFTGTWKADLAKSRFVGPAPASLQVTIEHHQPELREELLVTKADRTVDRAVFICRTSGEEGKIQFNGSPVRGAARWVGDELVLESWIKVGEREMFFCDCWSLSADGQTLIMEHRDDALAGQRVLFHRLS